MKLLVLVLALCACARSQQHRVGKFSEVYAWKQMTYDINGHILTEDRATAAGLERSRDDEGRSKRQSDNVYFNDSPEEERDWNNRYMGNHNYNMRPSNTNANKPNTNTKSQKLDERTNNFFIQYNNVPMGAERVGERLFIAVPRRRHGIPATLNYIDLSDTSRSPHLRPYPSPRVSAGLVSIYRTRADECDRLWAVDTGLMELPDTPQQVQRPAIVVFDLRTDQLIMRYELKDSDVPANNTPTGLASITLDTSRGCADTFAYVPDVTTFGIVVYSLRDNDSWRVRHNYFHFNPAAVNLRIAGHRFQWSDGIFSIVLAPGTGCRAAFFHPLISTQEFAVTTCTLNNRTAHTDPEYWSRYAIVGDRGPNTQSSMHDLHPKSGAMFFAAIGSDGVGCWNYRRPLNPESYHTLARDPQLMSYPADLHVTGGEVWVIANTMPRFSYSRLNPEEYNFYIYKGYVDELIAGTPCANAGDMDPWDYQFPSSNERFSSVESDPPQNDNYQSSTYNKYN